MFVRSRGVGFGFAEKMFTFCSAKSRKDVFSDDDFIYENWLVITASWEDLEAVVSVSNKFMSPCVICVVIARKIFLLQSDCPEITKCITNLKTTIETEILPLNVVDDQLVSVLFPVNVFRQICETGNLRVFFLIRLYFCCLLDQDLTGQCR